MQRFFFRLIGVALVIAAFGCGRSVPGVAIDPVPAKVPEAYRAVYRELESELSQLNPILAAPWGRKSGPTAFGVELLVADRNRGEDLLNEQVLQATALTLDRLKQIGVKSVSLSIQYPILTRSFPETPAYREFYRKVAAEVRQRGLLLVVEMGTMFRAPEVSRVPVDYKGLTRERFQRGAARDGRGGHRGHPPGLSDRALGAGHPGAQHRPCLFRFAVCRHRQIRGDGDWTRAAPGWGPAPAPGLRWTTSRPSRISRS